jgi:hypothetical protein
MCSRVMALMIINFHSPNGRRGLPIGLASASNPEEVKMSKKLKHKNRESKKDRAKNKDDQATPRDDNRDSTVPDDQKHDE